MREDIIDVVAAKIREINPDVDLATANRLALVFIASELPSDQGLALINLFVDHPEVWHFFGLTEELVQEIKDTQNNW